MATYAMGDLQCSFKGFLAVLDCRGLLTKDQRLKPGVSLVTVGDYFDYHDKETDSVEVTQKNGFEILSWLASHDQEQVTILLGNHDISRVQELIGMSDERFREARAMAFALDKPDSAWTIEDFFEAFPEIPNPTIVLRDFSSYGEIQRDLLKRLLLEGRVKLGAYGLWRGRGVLINHAGLTRRELSILGDDELRDPGRISGLLNKRLEDAVERVRESWERGEAKALDLEPLHVSGVAREEGGGLLYHRPSNPDFFADSWAYNKTRPRRYQPKDLPGGLLQVVGHTQHHKCLKELGDWIVKEARGRELFDLRTLRVRGGSEVRYEKGLPGELGADEAALLMVDGAINDCPAERYPLLELEELA